MVDILNPPTGQKSATRLGELVQARSLPSYAGYLPKNFYDPQTGFYNVKGSNLRRFHAAIIKTLQGTAKTNVLFLGDSSLIGYNGSAIKESIAIPAIFQESLASALGIRYMGGFKPWTMTIGTVSDKLTVNAGTVDSTSFPAIYTLNSGASVTWAPDNLGTIVEFWYANNSSSNFTYQIDGGTATAVTTTGAATWGKVTVSGLAYGQHTLRINAPTGAIFLGGALIGNASGIAVHSIAVGGARAASGNAFQNWTDTVSAPSIYVNRKIAYDTNGPTPDLVVLAIGGNDIANGDTAANAINGVNTIRGWYPSSDFLLIQTAGFSGATLTTYDDYCRRKYELCDTLDIGLLDYRHRLGDSAELLAFGLLGADNTHVIDAGNVEIGRTLGVGLAQIAGGTSPEVEEALYMKATGGGAEAVAAATGTAGTVTLNAAVASVFTLSPTADVTTLNITNVPTGSARSIGLIITQGGTARAIANPSGSKVMGVAVSQVANKVCQMEYFTVDGGTTWLVRGDREV